MHAVKNGTLHGGSAYIYGLYIDVFFPFSQIYTHPKINQWARERICIPTYVRTYYLHSAAVSLEKCIFIFLHGLCFLESLAHHGTTMPNLGKVHRCIPHVFLVFFGGGCGAAR